MFGYTDYYTEIIVILVMASYSYNNNNNGNDKDNANRIGLRGALLRLPIYVVTFLSNYFCVDILFVSR